MSEVSQGQPPQPITPPTNMDVQMDLPDGPVMGPPTQADAEAAAKKENENRDRQQGEAVFIGASMVEQSINTYRRDVKSMNPKQQAEYYEGNRKAQSARTIDFYMDHGDAQFDTENSDGKVLNGTPIVLMSKGKPREIHSILSIKNGNFTCSDVDGVKITVPRADFIAALIVSEKEGLSTGMNDHQKKVFNSYIDTLDPSINNESAQYPTDFDASLAEAGRSIGMLSMDALRTVIAHSGIPAEKQEVLIARLGDRIIARPEIAGSILSAVDPTPSKIAQLTELRDQHKLSFEIKQKAFKDKLITEAELTSYEAQLFDAESRLKMYEAYPKSEAAITEILKKTYSGEIAVADPAALDDRLRRNDFNGYFEKLTDDPNLTDKEKKDFKEMAASALKMGGIGALAIVALMIMQAVTAK